MKDSEFIELLNLYLDHEISAADAERLEAQVAANPARRRIYEDYCRMQKACKALAVDFATEAPSDRNIVAFESARPQRRGGLYGAGLLVAAAAAVAVVFVVRQQNPTQPGTTDGTNQATYAAQASTTAAQATVAATTLAPITLPVQVATQSDTATLAGMTPTAGERSKAAKGLSLASNAGAPAQEVILTAASQNASQFDWIHTLKLEPVQRTQIEDFHFDARAAASARNQPAAAPGAGRGQVEWAAFQYKK